MEEFNDVMLILHNIRRLGYLYIKNRDCDMEFMTVGDVWDMWRLVVNNIKSPDSDKRVYRDTMGHRMFKYDKDFDFYLGKYNDDSIWDIFEKVYNNLVFEELIIDPSFDIDRNNSLFNNIIKNG